MITEDYINFETAKLLKKKGFNEKCRYVYMPDGTRMAAQNFMEGEPFIDNDDINSVAKYHDWIVYTQGDYAFLCPTVQMVMKWLREVHNIHLLLDPCFDKNDKVVYGVNVLDKELIGSLYENLDDNTYEEACEAAIKYCFENLI